MYEETINYLKELFAGNSGGHDLDHTLRVYRNAVYIADRETQCDREIVMLGALLHDADDTKLFRTENNANARGIMKKLGIEENTINMVCEVINGVSFSHNRGRRPETLEGKIVQDADRLDAIGAIGIARTFAFGGEHGRSLQDSVQHFYDKLLLLKDEMNTETARQMAAERHAFLELYLEKLKKETGI
ncbi:MAG: HD domain-containing protein [Solobacterium sp.]|nr:HD domain-containing protein [Solobacterium sp.]